MKKIALISLLVCAALISVAQTNFVKNPSFEKYSQCPDDWNKIHYANSWRNVKDSAWEAGLEYYNVCGNSSLDKALHIPNNNGFWQNCRTGEGMVGITMYFDKTIPIPAPLPFNYRDNLQGHLIKPLLVGKNYCVSFWVNLTEGSGYSQNKIGAYFDNGKINADIDSAGKEITFITPQIYTNTIIGDTMNWVKIEGSFVATGIETHISIGNFFSNAATSINVTNYWSLHPTIAYYLIDDVSVIPIDLPADAGKDNWVELGKQVKIGRVGDTTAMGLDCKWYKKGVLIDSGAIITVNASSIKNAIDTYVVVQTICGNVKTDTVLVKTTGVGIKENSAVSTFSIYPNPSSGTISITSLHAVLPTKEGTIHATVYDLLGRALSTQKLTFINKQTTIKLEFPTGTFLLELQDEDGNVQRERIVIE